MAGNWPDPPGVKLPYDKDGTLGYMTYRGWSNGLPAQFTVVQTPIPEPHMRNMNDENGTTRANPSGVNSGSADMYLLFPSPRDITHIYIRGYGSTFQWSNDTTNGMDGTWTTVSGIVDRTAGTKESMRTEITTLSPALTGVRALRWTTPSGGSGSFGGVWTLHLYGKPTALGDRLEFWHPTLDQPLRDTPAHLDLGNRPRATSQTKLVRVKNCSPALVANDIEVGVDELTPATPTLASQTTLRYGGTGDFAATAEIPSLAPEQISGLVEMKVDLAGDSQLGLVSERLYAVAAGWA